MIPQIIATIWLTTTFIFFVRKMGITDARDVFISVIAATIQITIIVVALYYGGFWTAP